MCHFVFPGADVVSVSWFVEVVACDCDVSTWKRNQQAFSVETSGWMRVPPLPFSCSLSGGVDIVLS